MKFITLADSMKESKFVEQNKTKWSKFDEILKQKHPNPVELNRLFVELTDDLSYARSRYRNRSVRVYLNWMMQRLFNQLYRKRKIGAADVISFFKDEIPYIMYLSRKFMYVSLLFFVLGASIGIVSSYHDPSFATLILGEDYVDMTISNIESGDPMRVYKSAFPEKAFSGILFNNARIDVMVFASGLLFGILSLFFLVKNAVMVGVFQFFFFQHGGFSDSLLTIWMHGSIEISTIVLVCGAGILGGSGWMFPGTRTRFQAFRISGLKAAKLLVAILPFTLLAAFIEAFITPLELPAAINVLFILVTLGMMMFYFVWYPYYRYHGSQVHEKYDVYLPYVKQPKIELFDIRKGGEIVVEAFFLYSRIIGKVLPVVLASLGVLFFAQLRWGVPLLNNARYDSSLPVIKEVLYFYGIPNLSDFFSANTWPIIILAALSIWGIGFMTIFQLKKIFSLKAKLLGLSKRAFFWGIPYVGVISIALLWKDEMLQFVALYFVMMSGFIFGYVLDSRRREQLKGKWFDLYRNGFFSFLRVFVLLLGMMFFLFLIVQSPLIILLKDFFLDSLGKTMISLQTESLISIGISLFVLFLLCPLFVITGFLNYFNSTEKQYSIELRNRLKKWDLI